MTYQYMQLQMIVQQRRETLLREAAHERLVASLRSNQKGEKRFLSFSHWLRQRLTSEVRRQTSDGSQVTPVVSLTRLTSDV